MQIHELDTSFGLGVLKRSGSMVFSLRLAAVGLLGAVTLAPEAALAFNRLPLHPTPVGASVHGAVSAVKPAAIRMRAPRSARGVRMSSVCAARGGQLGNRHHQRRSGRRGAHPDLQNLQRGPKNRLQLHQDVMGGHFGLGR